MSWPELDQCDSASEVANSINILTAIRWVALAWTKVNPETISKCFRKVGVLQDAMVDVVARAHDTKDDPFLESDACMFEKNMPSEQRCSLAEYLSGEEGVPVCVDMDGEDWDANFIAQFVMVMVFMVMKLVMMIWMLMKSMCVGMIGLAT